MAIIKRPFSIKIDYSNIELEAFSLELPKYVSTKFAQPKFNMAIKMEGTFINQKVSGNYDLTTAKEMLMKLLSRSLLEKLIINLDLSQQL